MLEKEKSGLGVIAQMGNLGEKTFRCQVLYQLPEAKAVEAKTKNCSSDIHIYVNHHYCGDQVRNRV